MADVTETALAEASCMQERLPTVDAFTGGTRRMRRPLRSGRKPTTDDTNHATMAGELTTG